MKEIVRCPICKELYFAEEMISSPVSSKICSLCEDKQVTIDYAGSCLGCIGSLLTSVVIALIGIIVLTAIIF